MAKNQRHSRRNKGKNGRKPPPNRRPSPPAKPETPGFDLATAVRESEVKIRKWLVSGQEVQRQAKEPRSPDALDEWQQTAYDHLIEGANVIVDAPTTAGKTRVVEVYFRNNLHRPDFRAAYTTPVKSLSNDKVKEFREMFGAENVGIATGDVKENLSAPIVVATLESYRNSLLGVEPDLGRSLVVFDEYHFLQDTSRGSAWEEAMILSPDSCQVLLLSASVANTEDFAAWLGKIKNRPVKKVQAKHRPVPLEDVVYYHGHWLLRSSMKLPRPNPKDNLYRFPLKHEEIGERLPPLLRLGLTPCIVYCGQRNACETLAMRICDNLPPLNERESATIREQLDNAGVSAFLKSTHKRLLIRYGVGYHHSGMAPQARVAIETLVKEGQLRFCVATMGLSIGINFSVRSALIADYRRPSELGFVQYSPSEVLQMLGRAGRRGRDAVGFSLWPSYQSYHRLGEAERENCYSRLRNDPTTFLGLLGRGFALGEVERFYNDSFMRFRNRQVDLSVVRRPVLLKKLEAADAPCTSPTSAFASYLREEPASPCQGCPMRKRCHPYLEQRMQGSLAYLHLHLHLLGCIDPEEHLTSYGSIARYFPQAGGLLIAQMLDQGQIHGGNLLDGVELMAALTMARFKEPYVDKSYKFPFNEQDLEEQLEKFYPYELFEELYDPPFGRRHFPILREFNPAAGYIAREWLTGHDWDSLSRRVTHEKFGQGDLMALLYRTATYLQSLSQAGLGDVSHNARHLWQELMRPPLVVSLAGPA